MALSISE